MKKRFKLSDFKNKINIYKKSKIQFDLLFILLYNNNY